MKSFLSWFYIAAVGLVIFRLLVNGQELMAYFDLTSALLVFVPSFLMFLMNRGKEDVVKGVMSISLLAGLFGLLVGFVLTFSNYYLHKEAEGVFVGLSVALLPLLYAVALNVFLFPFRNRKNVF